MALARERSDTEDDELSQHFLDSESFHAIRQVPVRQSC